MVRGDSSIFPAEWENQEFLVPGSLGHPMPSAPSWRSGPVLDDRAGPSCDLSCLSLSQFYERLTEKFLEEALSSPRPMWALLSHDELTSSIPP